VDLEVALEPGLLRQASGVDGLERGEVGRCRSISPRTASRDPSPSQWSSVWIPRYVPRTGSSRIVDRKWASTRS
jgi:hypothetical protein